METVNSQLTRTLVGIGPYYYLVQFATALLLVLAANTAFADFPRLAYFMARDKFLPRHFAFRGDRLAFTGGIIVLAAVAAVLILLFRGSVTGLMPLYGRRLHRLHPLPGGPRGPLVAPPRAGLAPAPGGQRRRGRHHRRRGRGGRRDPLHPGAWVVLLLIPGLVALLLGIRRHFDSITDHLTLTSTTPGSTPTGSKGRLHHYILIPVRDLNRATTRAIAYARSLTGGPTAATPGGGGRTAPAWWCWPSTSRTTQTTRDQLQEKWERFALACRW